jgi:hypothetical protein
MNTNLFRLSLEQMQPSDWAIFERLCSEFLAGEFGNLRTMAHPSGDGGRDSELFSPESDPSVVAQYSVQKDWKVKIKKTVKDLKEKFPSVKVLLFMSNQQIGGQADKLKREVLSDGIYLDLRDRNWFIDRLASDSKYQDAAKELIDRIAKPFLEGEDIIERPTSPLTSAEAKAAVLYLGLQFQDDVAEKGLTKLCFDALVRAALRQTHSQKRLSRKKVCEIVSAVLPNANIEILSDQIDSALKRLTRRYIRHWEKDDEFCLTHDEHLRITSRLADSAVEDADFLESVQRFCALCLVEIDQADHEDQDDLVLRVPRILERLLLSQGEDFATAVVTNNLNRIRLGKLNDFIFMDLDQIRPVSKITQHYPQIITMIIQYLLTEANESIWSYLKRLSDSYTLFAFLTHTPDVQSATRKLFSHGTIWIDTTVLLPILAERIDDDQENWRLTNALIACGESGIKWRVTSGIIREVNAHMNTAIACSHYQPLSWRGRIPYLYYKFLCTGRTPAEFRKWISLFRGSEQPEDDIAQFLLDVLGIERQDLIEESRTVDDDLRYAAGRLWKAAHEERRQRSEQPISDETTQMLIEHDLETYLGVIALRKLEQVTELGYLNWLLTRDSIAWMIRDSLYEEFQGKTPPSPLMSLSYLLNTMAFGGNRSKSGKTAEHAIPLFLDIEMSESESHELVRVADEVRRDNAGLPEPVIRRNVRDAINKIRRHWKNYSLEPVQESEEVGQSLRTFDECTPTDQGDSN